MAKLPPPRRRRPAPARAIGPRRHLHARASAGARRRGGRDRLRAGEEPCALRLRLHHHDRPRHHRLLQSQPPVPLPGAPRRTLEGRGGGRERARVPARRGDAGAAHRRPRNPDRATAPGLVSSPQISSEHGNIKEGRFGLDYFSSFNIVLNALDNVDARRHVNRSSYVPVLVRAAACVACAVAPLPRGEKRLRVTSPVCAQAVPRCWRAAG